MPSPRILYVWKGRYPFEIRIRKIISSLSESGFEVFTLCRGERNRPEEETLDGARIVRSKAVESSIKYFPYSINPIWRKEIRKTVEKLRPDIVMPREFMLATACADAAKKVGAKTIIDMAEHYPAAMRLWKKYNRNPISRILNHTLKVPDYLERKAIEKADGIVTVCEEQNERLARDFGFPREKLQVVMNTPPRGAFDEVADSTTDAKFPTFGIHGHVTAEKKIDNFVKGFLLAAETNPGIKLIVAGEGDSFAELRQIVANSSYSDRVEPLGKYDHDKDLKNILKRIDVGVAPYEINDFNEHTIHNRIFDYFASGKPVLASNMTPTKRILKETGAGISIDCESPENIAREINRFPIDKIPEMRKNSRNAAETKYYWEKDAANLVDFLNKFAGR